MRRHMAGSVEAKEVMQSPPQKGIGTIVSLLTIVLKPHEAAHRCQEQKMERLSYKRGEADNSRMM